MVAWPVDLPQSPLFNGYKRREAETAIETQMDAGVPKSRQRFTAASEPLTWPTLFTDTQRDSFETFYKTTIRGGALSFDITLPDVSGTSSVRIVDPPTYQPVKNDLWFVELSMIKLP